MLAVTILIPVYQPHLELIELVAALRAVHYQSIIVVNDGSDLEHETFFRRLEDDGIIVLHHEKNLGKGRALQTGFQYWYDNLRSDTCGIVTADADGQHAVADITTVANNLMAAPTQLHLGVREFLKDIPLRSRIGNTLTRKLFNLMTRQNLHDTQTGLRGIPKKLIRLLQRVKSHGYEFELEMLFIAIKYKIDIAQHPIETLYIDHNESSHFNPIKDSIKIYKALFRNWLAG